MIVERTALVVALALLLDTVGLDYHTLPYWAILLSMIAYGWTQYSEGYDTATELAQSAWRHAKATLEEAIRREERVQQLVKEYKEEQHNDTP